MSCQPTVSARSLVSTAQRYVDEQEPRCASRSTQHAVGVRSDRGVAPPTGVTLHAAIPVGSFPRNAKETGAVPKTDEDWQNFTRTYRVILRHSSAFMALHRATANTISDMPPWIADHVAPTRNNAATPPVITPATIPHRIAAIALPMVNCYCRPDRARPSRCESPVIRSWGQS